MKPQKAGRRGQIPKEEQGKQGAVPKKARERQRSPGTTSARVVAAVFTSAIHPPNNLSVTSPARSAT